MAHVELSLSESLLPPAGDAAGEPTGNEPLRRWAATVACANEPCLVIDREAVVLAASAACHELLGMGSPGSAEGRFLLDCVGRLVDFTAAREPLDNVEIDKIPPLLALSSGRLARGLMRVYDGRDFDVTVDAITTPLSDGTVVVGALTFFCAV